MRDLARLRAQADKLRTRSGAGSSPALGLLADALALVDRIREQAATLHERCAALERTAREEARRRARLLDQLPIGVVITDRTAMISGANRVATKMLGRSVARLENRLLLHYTEERDRFTTIVRQLPDVDTSFEVSLRFRPSDRAPFDADVKVLRDEPDEQYLWFVMRRDG